MLLYLTKKISLYSLLKRG